MKLLSATLLVSLTVLFACKNPQELEVETIPVVPKATVATDLSSYNDSSPIGIEDVEVAGNKMSITIKYSGGCKEHAFELVGHRMITKSIPPQRSIKLYHNNNGDDCRELINDILIFDISAFAVGDQEVSLKLDGYDKTISYTPVK